MTVDRGSHYGSLYGSRYCSHYGSLYGSHPRRPARPEPACRLPLRRPASLTSIPKRGSKS